MRVSPVPAQNYVERSLAGAVRGAQVVAAKGLYSPSGTSSRPLSAMIASVYASDYWCSTVVEEKLLAGWKAGVITWIPPLLL
jgi:hypothetical protein